MEKMVKKMSAAAKAYYSGHESSMYDKEYDALYEQLPFFLKFLKL